MKIPRCDIATHGLKGALRSQGGCRFSTPPRYNSNCTKERSSSTSQVPATIAVSGWIWLWYKLICTRDWVESTQSETPEGSFQSERGDGTCPWQAPFSLFPCNATPSPWCCQIMFQLNLAGNKTTRR